MRKIMKYEDFISKKLDEKSIQDFENFDLENKDQTKDIQVNDPEDL